MFMQVRREEEGGKSVQRKSLRCLDKGLRGVKTNSWSIDQRVCVCVCVCVVPTVITVMHGSHSVEENSPWTP